VHVTKVAVVAHAGKSVGGGLPELRTELARRGIERPLWYEVPKSKKAPKRVQEALDAGAELVFAWGGDGTVQRCIDVMAGSEAKLAVVPAGTANLFASNLDIPEDIADAVDVGLHGATRTIDVGKIKGERFAVMAGAGLDARMIRGADGTLKDRLGRLAYVWTGAKAARASTFDAKIEVDGTPWYEGKASLVLAGNLGKLFAGVEAFEGARPDDGELELGIVRAEGLVEWARTVARAAVGTPADSPFVQQTRARSVRAELDRKVVYELDGGARDPVKRFQIDVEPAAISVRVPDPTENGK
jgi:diacylglycerol kinase (ATP)